MDVLLPHSQKNNELIQPPKLLRYHSMGNSNIQLNFRQQFFKVLKDVSRLFQLEGRTLNIYQTNDQVALPQ
ncbi:hypothetical protein pb186bvf_009747 [Paramecium bursaria]